MKQRSIMEKKSKLLAIIPGIIALVAIVFFLSILIIKYLWGWVIPDLFPKAVEEKYVAEEISWFVALKLSLFIALIGGMLKGYKNNK